MSNLPRNRRSRLHCLGLPALVLVIAAIGVGGWMVYIGVSTSLQAENNLQATLFAIRLVDQFVYEKGRWPQSWQELKELQFPGPSPSPVNSGLIGWSSDWPTGLQERVAIDFQADATAVAQQDPMTFDAIRPIGPRYDAYRNFVCPLQEALKRTITRNGQRLPKLDTANGKATANRLMFPEAIERAMLMDARTTSEQFRQTEQIGPMELRGSTQVENLVPPARQEPPPTLFDRKSGP